MGALAALALLAARQAEPGRRAVARAARGRGSARCSSTPSATAVSFATSATPARCTSSSSGASPSCSSATSLDAIEFNAEQYLGWHLPTRNVGVQLELIWDIGGVMLIAGIALAAWRRYVVRPPRLNTMLENNVLLVLLLASALSGFVLQSLRMAADGDGADERPVQHGVGILVAVLLRHRGGHPWGGVHDLRDGGVATSRSGGRTRG